MISFDKMNDKTVEPLIEIFLTVQKHSVICDHSKFREDHKDLLTSSDHPKITYC